jgi:hypothetical protein
MYNENTAYSNLVKELERVRQDLKNENEEAAFYRKWADKIIFKRLDFEEAPGKGITSITQKSLDGAIKDDPLVPRPSLLEIEDFAVDRINLALDFNFSFKLLNSLSRNKKLSGYIFIIASNQEAIPPLYGTWPQVDISSGMPENFTKGEDFSIRYLKNIRGRINQPDIGSKFNRVDMIAYSEDGRIIMKKGFFIERLLQESPFE